MSTEVVIERAVDLLGESWASYSPCGTYRYELVRRWGSGPLLRFVMLNPSTATHLVDDRTVARCRRRAQDLGYAGLLVQNMFAFRATKPAALRRADDPVGPGNDAVLGRPSEPVAATVVAWGIHGALHGRSTAVLDVLPGDVTCLGITRDGHPRHPLYVAGAQPLIPYHADAADRLALVEQP
jgi:hypothetical protein